MQEPQQQQLSAGCLNWPSEGATKGSQEGEGSSSVSLMWSAAKLSLEHSLHDGLEDNRPTILYTH